MTFHPLIDYAKFHKSERALGDAGAPFVYTPEHRARRRCLRARRSSA